MAKILYSLKRTVWQKMSAVKIIREHLWDALRYQKMSTPTSKHALGILTGKQLECQITKDYHRIEKGLSFGTPKRPFGADAESRLNIAFSKRADVATAATRVYGHATSAMEALSLWNETGVIDDTIGVPSSQLPKFKISGENLRAFFFSRRSVRAFNLANKVNPAIVEEAVILAGSSPSVCNRQSWKAHYFDDPEMIKNVLSHQSGNRGFGSEATGVLVVTSDVQHFSGSGERNQRWVDGGIFAMSLVWALHGLGVSTCMLNWSKSNAESAGLRKAAQLTESEDIVVLIAIGYPIDNFRVARSPRRSSGEIFRHHNVIDEIS